MKVAARREAAGGFPCRRAIWGCFDAVSLVTGPRQRQPGSPRILQPTASHSLRA